MKIHENQKRQNLKSAPFNHEIDESHFLGRLWVTWLSHMISEILKSLKF